MMKAVVLTKPTKAEAIVLSEVEVPTVKPGWVLVKIKAFGLNHSEQILREFEIENDYINKKDMKVPPELIPHCPICGKPMTMNLRSDDKFVEDEGWHRAAERYNTFINENKSKNVVYLELGVGGNTPSIIKYPFWQLTAQNKNSTYICINLGESFCPDEIAGQSVCINADIGKVIEDLT